MSRADEEDLRGHLILAAVEANPKVKGPTWKAYFDKVMRNARIDWLKARSRYASSHLLGGDRVETLTMAGN
jgi:DNA-directed RNA polymerase specialized sigma24 family protein